MSIYTTELRYLIEQENDIGLSHYPIYDGLYRTVLNKKITDHYFFHEIGFETVERFRHHLSSRMNIIMPYYNKLYLQEVRLVNPLYTVDYTETFEKVGQSDSTGEGSNSLSATDGGMTEADTTTQSTGSDKGLSVESDTPGGMLLRSEILDDTYASKAQRHDTDTNDTTQSEGVTRTQSSSQSNSQMTSLNSVESTEEYIRKVQGNNSGRSNIELFEVYRNNLMNIDRLIIAELKDLFMGVY